MVFITGDCHGNFRRFNRRYFPEQETMDREDYIIIAGDYTVKNIMPKPFILY